MTIEEAKTLAEKLHAGKFRRDGVTPCILHPMKVATLLENDYQKCIALLHDTIEDGLITFEELSKFDPSIALHVLKLTHSKSKSYEEYIREIKRYGIPTTTIKIADIVANLTDDPTEEQVLKYIRALQILSS